VNIKSIKVGDVVDTSVGFGRVERVGGTHPPSVRVVVVGPVPRGTSTVTPRQVLRRLEDSEVDRLKRDGWPL